MRKKLLFVDDELGIRMTLPTILENEGFDVSVASSVPEALHMIQNKSFDILLSDLNIGQPGDGFTVVSAMRRIQPEAATLILTGYPDFESALTAIRNQVDDYLVKPADIQKLVQTLREKSSLPRIAPRAVPRKRISEIIRENRDEIVDRWVKRMGAKAEISRLRLSKKSLINHLPDVLEGIAERIESADDEVNASTIKAASNHGVVRSQQDYSIPLLLVEGALMEKIIAELLQENLLSVDISTVISDMHRMSETIHCAVEFAVRAYLELAAEPQTA